MTAAPEPINRADELYRWILEKWIVHDSGVPGGTRLSSEAFEESSDDEFGTGGVSAYVAKEISAEQVLEKGKSQSALPVCSVAAIQVEVVIGAEYEVIRRGEPSHVDIIPPSNIGTKELKRRRRRLAAACHHVLGRKWGNA